MARGGSSRGGTEAGNRPQAPLSTSSSFFPLQLQMYAAIKSGEMCSVHKL
jgi:hypothetical protein